MKQVKAENQLLKSKKGIPEIQEAPKTSVKVDLD